MIATIRIFKFIWIREFLLKTKIYYYHIFKYVFINCLYLFNILNMKRKQGKVFQININNKVSKIIKMIRKWEKFLIIKNCEK